MVRIKGVNSDYQFNLSKGQIEEVTPQPTPLYMKLFICPNDQPSSIDQRKSADQKCCDGLSQTCPGKEKQGHALVELDQVKGLTLASDRNQLILDQQGTLCLAAGQQVEVQGKLIVKSANQQTVVLSLSEQGLEIQLSNGAGIRIEKGGNVSITPAAFKKVTIADILTVENETVTVTKNLKIQGTLDAKLSDMQKQALIKEIKESLGK